MIQMTAIEARLPGRRWSARSGLLRLRLGRRQTGINEVAEIANSTSGGLVFRAATATLCSQAVPQSCLRRVATKVNPSRIPFATPTAVARWPLSLSDVLCRVPVRACRYGGSATSPLYPPPERPSPPPARRKPQRRRRGRRRAAAASGAHPRRPAPITRIARRAPGHRRAGLTGHPITTVTRTKTMTAFPTARQRLLDRAPARPRRDLCLRLQLRRSPWQGRRASRALTRILKGRDMSAAEGTTEIWDF
jgi:hypothetical protein